jgi:branched-chain amino acid transport system substrate-binding protein
MKKNLILLFACMYLGSIPASAFCLDTIRVAAVFSKSGEAMAISDEHLIVVRMAVAEINLQGGLLGRQIELLEFDNQSTGLGSQQAAKEVVKAGVCAVVGPSWSSHALAMAPILQAQQVPMITPTSTSPKVTQVGDFIFRVCFIDSFQGDILAGFAAGDLKFSRVAVLVNTGYVYCTDLADRFRKAFKAGGGEIPISIDYSENLTDYAKMLGMLKGYEYDGLFIPGYSRDSAQIIKKAREMGIHCAILGGDGWSNLMYNYAPENALSHTYYLSHWFKTVQDPASLAFVEKLRTVFDDDKINAGMALSYDSVYLLADAVRRAGSADPTQIRAALAATTDFRGVTGRISFGPDRNPVKPAVILQFKDGTSNLVKQYTP